MISVTIFPNLAARGFTTRSMTLDEIAALIASTSAPTKETLPLLSLARFGKQRSDRGSLRHAANVVAITGAVIDYDCEQVPFDAAVDMLRQANVTALVYTTPSYRPDAPRWRVLCPTSTPLPPDRYGPLVSRVNRVIGGIAGPESWTLSQSFYFGGVTGVSPQIAIIGSLQTSRPIDLCDALDKGAISKPGSRATCHSDRIPHEAEAPIEAIRAALDIIPNDDLDWHDWNRIGMATWRASGGSAEAFAVFAAWSAQSAKYDPTETRARWHRYSTSPPTMTGFGTLVIEARRTVPWFVAPAYHTGLRCPLVDDGHRKPGWVNSREVRYADTALTNAMNELASVWRAPAAERFRRLNALAYKMGRFAVRGWVEEPDVYFRLVHGAGHLVRAYGVEQVRATIGAGLAAGTKHPYPDLPPLRNESSNDGD